MARHFAFLATAVVLATAVRPVLGQTRPLVDLDKAVAASSSTGKPLLAIAGSTGCVYCKKMAAQLTRDPQVAPVASKFVALLIDTGTPVWQRWQSRYRVEGDGIPKVFVIRADGEQIYAGTGAPKDLKGFLQRRLEKAGTVPNQRTLAAFQQASRQVKQAENRGDRAEAVRLAVEHAAPDCYATPARELQRAAERFAKDAVEKLDGAVEGLQETEGQEAFEAALQLAEMKRVYQPLPPVQEKLKEIETAGIPEEKQPLVKQAELVDRGRQQEEEHEWEAALASYRKVLDEHDESPAAEAVQRKIARVEKRMEAGQDEEASTANTSESGKEDRNLKRAKSSLRLGKLLLKKNNSKAGKYFEKAVKLAPGTPVAEEAKRLLEELKR